MQDLQKMEIEVFRGSEAKEVPEYGETVLRNIKNIENRLKRSNNNLQAEYLPRSEMQNVQKTETELCWGSEAQELSK